VDAKGVLSLGSRSRYVGTRFKGRRVYVSLDPCEVEWLVLGEDGVCYTNVELVLPVREKRTRCACRLLSSRLA